MMQRFTDNLTEAARPEWP